MPHKQLFTGVIVLIAAIGVTVLVALASGLLTANIMSSNTL
jgi:hypothetical protein